MFTFFTALADAYSKVLMPPKSMAQRLRRDADDKTAVLDRCLKRLEWERSQERCVRLLFLL
jgi:splicing factor 3A subunit 1